MDIIGLGAEILRGKLGQGLDADIISKALGGLLSGQDGKIDIQGLVAKFMADGGLQNIVGSWLGDGGNDGITGEQISQILGKEQISSFASQLGIDDINAAESLAEAVPQMIDKSSSGGSLLDNVSDLGNVLDMAKKFF